MMWPIAKKFGMMAHTDKQHSISRQNTKFQIYKKSKMGDGYLLENRRKLSYLNNSLTDWHDDSLTLNILSAVKISNM